MPILVILGPSRPQKWIRLEILRQKMVSGPLEDENKHMSLQTCEITKLFTLRAPAEANGRPGGKKRRRTIHLRIARAHGHKQILCKADFSKGGSQFDCFKRLCEKY